jgi:hypothetical protein
MRSHRLAFLALLLLAPIPAARAQVAQGTAVRPPQFDEYPAGAKFTGKHHAPVLTQESREFRTRLREGAKEKVNFAGHYVFTTWGCGAECLMGAAIDVKTGKVFLLPFTLCCWAEDTDPYEIHVESRLIAFQGERNEKGGPGTWYYQIDDKKGWVVVREVPRPPLGQG